ncbi:hypothetical protein V1477_003610 [Vespula maculifrons]|uniref:Uncharacterized protein n=1 Tax=Vespula maculifrons TaxID=7453 RepID=A0ABD2CTA2_VESMC
MYNANCQVSLNESNSQIESILTETSMQRTAEEKLDEMLTSPQKGAKREDSLGLLRACIKSCRAPIVVWHWSGCRRRVRAVREESAVKSVMLSQSGAAASASYIVVPP